jgi:hypothetical protein
LLAFSRRQRLDPKPFEVNDVLENMHDLLQSTIGGGIVINTLFGLTSGSPLLIQLR